MARVLSLTGASTKIGYMFGIVKALLTKGEKYDVVICTSATAIVMIHALTGNFYNAENLIVNFTDKQIFKGFKPLFNNGFPTPIAFLRFLTGKNSLGKQAGLYDYLRENISKEMFYKWQNDMNLPDILVYVYNDNTSKTELIPLRNLDYETAMNVIEASSNIPIFINPKRIGFTDFYDGGTITANASTIFLEMNKNVTHLDSIWQRKIPTDVQKDLKEISLNKWFPLAIGNYFMKLRMLNESVLCEKYQNALCEIGGVKVRNFYTYTEVDSQYDNQANEKQADIKKGFNETIKIIQ